jgi:hypothetical protein
LDLTKRGWGELKRLSKHYENYQEPATPESGGGVPFLENLKNKPLGLSNPTGQTGRVTPTGLRALSEENSLNWQIWVRSQTCLILARLVR